MTRDDILKGLGCSVDFLASLETERIILVRDGEYEATTIERIRVCWGLHDDLGVNLAGLEVALHLLERLDTERRQHLETLRKLRAVELAP